MKDPGIDLFLSLLLSKNSSLNLTAIRDPGEAMVRHISDALAVYDLFPIDGKSIIDVGSGGGLPGIPLRLRCPGVRMTLLDAKAKKIEYLQSVCDIMGLNDVACVAARAEELARMPGFRDSFDVAVARGVAYLPILTELCLPFVKPGGHFLAMKGEDPASEVLAAGETTARLGGRTVDVIPYSPGLGVRHTLVVVEKTSPTPRLYPRKWARIVRGQEQAEPRIQNGGGKPIDRI